MNTTSSDRAAHSGWYRIRIKGRLAPRWATRFDGMAQSYGGDGTTLLEGFLVDQAALHGLLHQVRDTGLPLVSVTRAGPDQPEQAGRHHTPTARPRPPRSTNEGDPR